MKRFHRRSTRLRGYNYASPGAYFVTICVQRRKKRPPVLLGEIVDGEMRLNAAGRMVEAALREIPRRYPGVRLDAFVVMPDHIHVIFVLVGATLRGCPLHHVGTGSGVPCGDVDGHDWGTRHVSNSAVNGRDAVDAGGGVACDVVGGEGQPRGVAPTGVPGVRTMTLGDVVHRFKITTTKRYSDGVTKLGWSRFDGRLWQRNYYDGIIRGAGSLARVRRYIINNPRRG